LLRGLASLSLLLSFAIRSKTRARTRAERGHGEARGAKKEKRHGEPRSDDDEGTTTATAAFRSFLFLSSSLHSFSSALESQHPPQRISIKGPQREGRLGRGRKKSPGAPLPDRTLASKERERKRKNFVAVFFPLKKNETVPLVSGVPFFLLPLFPSFDPRDPQNFPLPAPKRTLFSVLERRITINDNTDTFQEIDRKNAAEGRER